VYKPESDRDYYHFRGIMNPYWWKLCVSCANLSGMAGINICNSY